MDASSEWLVKSEVAELITRYAMLSDEGEWEALAALYTNDGRMSRPTAPDEFICGRAAILAGFRSRPPRLARHIVANIVVQPEGGDAATASSRILLYTGVAAADGGLPRLGPDPPLIGSYRDRLVRTAAGWRFAERRGNLEFRPGSPAAR